MALTLTELRCQYSRWLVYGCVACAICLPSIAQGQTSSSIRLTDVTKSSGIQFVHSDGGSGKRTIVESVVGGLATLDYDGDGFQDIFFVNGQRLDDSSNDPKSGNANALRPALYRNNGDFTFTDVTLAAGVSQPSYGMGAVVADYDEDGDPDLVVSNFGQNILYRNNGDGTFTDATVASGLTLPDKVGAGCVFVDIENDGDLDLYAGSYVQFKLTEHKMRYIGQHAFHPGPTDYPPGPDTLFRNEGDGTFTDISQTAGITAVSSYSMGAIALDVDDDLDNDIFVVNDQRPNTLWINDGLGRFEDQAVISGLAFDRSGKANGNMGIDAGDVNGDGLLDLFTTTYQDEMPVLYMNFGAGQFMDQTGVARIDNRLHPHVTWGCGLVDFDNDSDVDLYVACGHFMDNIRFIDDRTAVKVRDFVLENRGGKFVDVSATCGSGLEVVESSRGVALEDFDNDGDVDAVVLNANAPPTLLRNDSTAKGAGLSLQLIGTRSNRSAVGSTCRVLGGPAPQFQQVHSGRGYQSHFGSHLHVSTPQGADVRVEVQWPSGHKEIFIITPGKTLAQLVEGQGSL